MSSITAKYSGYFLNCTQAEAESVGRQTSKYNKKWKNDEKGIVRNAIRKGKLDETTHHKNWHGCVANI